MIIVHGGAGAWKDERISPGVDYVTKAAEIGFKTLLGGGSSLDAAEACTLYMESTGFLNAGRGATKNDHDEAELDAMIVDGENLRFGSVGSIRGIENPISLARYIMEETDYVFFVGEGAMIKYREMIEKGYRKETDFGVVTKPFDIGTADTVGCVVVDKNGIMAATSSTGGIRGKPLGRVGDSPVFGSGAFANKVAGASATGYGEHIMRVTLTRNVVNDIESGMDVQSAAEKGIKFLADMTGSEAGVIAADSKGNWGRATNARAMPTAVIRHDLSNLQTFY
jgi:beta-aspartyl-peptidase (threonine type)